jgi:hypothetical protein
LESGSPYLDETGQKGGRRRRQRRGGNISHDGVAHTTPNASPSPSPTITPLRFLLTQLDMVTLQPRPDRTALGAGPHWCSQPLRCFRSQRRSRASYHRLGCGEIGHQKSRETRSHHRCAGGRTSSDMQHACSSIIPRATPASNEGATTPYRGTESSNIDRRCRQRCLHPQRPCCMPTRSIQQSRHRWRCR